MLSAIELSDLTSSLLFIQGRSCWCSVRSAASECIPHRLVACTLLSAGNGGLVTEREGGKPWDCHPRGQNGFEFTGEEENAAYPLDQKIYCVVQ